MPRDRSLIEMLHLTLIVILGLIVHTFFMFQINAKLEQLNEKK